MRDAKTPSDGHGPSSRAKGILRKISLGVYPELGRRGSTILYLRAFASLRQSSGYTLREIVRLLFCVLCALCGNFRLRIPLLCDPCVSVVKSLLREIRALRRKLSRRGVANKIASQTGNDICRQTRQRSRLETNYLFLKVCSCRTDDNDDKWSCFHKKGNCRGVQNLLFDTAIEHRGRD